MGPLGHIGETPGEALQVVRFTGHRIGHFEPSCSCFPITGQVLAKSPGAGPFHSFGYHGKIRLYDNGQRIEPYCEDSAIGLIPDIITHLGFGKDLSLYLTIFPLEMVFTS